MFSMRKLVAALTLWLSASVALAVPAPVVVPAGPGGAASTLSTGNAIAALITNPVTTGLIAEYPMNDGSGTVVKDISGNGNTANFAAGGNAPAWLTYGVAFSSPNAANFSPTWVQTPVKTWKTVVMYLCPGLGPATTGTGTGGFPYALYPTYFGPPGTADGIYLIGSTTLSNNYNGSLNPSIFNPAATAFTTTTAAPLQGYCGALAVSLDTLDHIYLNGSEISYGSQSSSASLVTTTTAGYQIGLANSASINTFKGVVGYLAIYSGVLTPAQIAQVSAFETFQVQNRVGFPLPTKAVSQTQEITFSGDSLTAGYQGSAQWTSQTYLSLNNTYNIFNYGVGGLTPQTLFALEPLRACSQVPAAAGRNVYHLWAGTNSSILGGYTATQTWAALQATARVARSCGFDKIIIATMISRTGQATFKNALNTRIRSYWASVADALDDLAAVPGLGADSAYSSTSCFNADQVHLNGPGAGSCANSLTGYGVVAAQAGKVVNILDGSTIDNPTVTTSNAYTQAIADNVVLQTPTAAATNILPDCTGLTGIKRTIINGSPTYAITESSAGGLSITGSTTISANATAAFTCNLTSATAGGNFWVRTQ